MKYSKNINTFDNETDFINYILSDDAGFPNVAVTTNNNKVHYIPEDYFNHSSETIYYNNVLYKWQNNAWTPVSAPIS